MGSAGMPTVARSGALLVFTAILLCLTAPVSAEDGYRLWLRYDRLPGACELRPSRYGDRRRADKSDKPGSSKRTS
jgi:hypothetical protein